MEQGRTARLGQAAALGILLLVVTGSVRSAAQAPGPAGKALSLLSPALAPSAAPESSGQTAGATASSPTAGKPAGQASPASSEQESPHASRVQRDKIVTDALGELTARQSQPLAPERQLALYTTITRAAQMEVYTFEAETSTCVQERDDTARRATDLQQRLESLPKVIGSGSIAALNATGTRKAAQDTLAVMNQRFDKALEQRSQLTSQLVDKYTAEATAAQKLSGTIYNKTLSPIATQAANTLAARATAAQKLLEVLDDLLQRTVAVSQSAAQLLTQMTQTERETQQRGILAQSGPPLGADTFAKVAGEMVKLEAEAEKGFGEAGTTLSQRDLPAGAALTVLMLLAFGFLWFEVRHVPGRIASETDEQGRATRVGRALRMLVPATRAVLVMAWLATAMQVWGLPDDWTIDAVVVSGFWAVYFIWDWLLRETLAPASPEFRVLAMRDEAASALYGVVRAVGLLVVCFLSVIYLLRGLAQVPTVTVRVLQMALGLGVLGLGGGLIYKAGGVSAVLPAPKSRRRRMARHAGMLLVLMLGLGALAEVVAAAGGYSNLSAYLSRGLALEVVLVLVAAFLYRLLLPGDDGKPIAHPALRALFWVAVVGLQAPIWQIGAYDVSVAYQLLSAPVAKGEAGQLSVVSVVKGILFIILTYLVARFIRRRLRTSAYLGQRLASGIPYALATVSFYTIVVLGTLAGVMVCGLKLNILAVLAGTAGIGLGLGLQDMFKNFVAGLVLILERPVAVGDFVEVGDFKGYVVGINLRSSTIRRLDNNLVVVPNSDLAAARVVNLTQADKRVRVTVTVGVSYDSDLRVVQDVLLRAAHENARVLADPAPSVWLTDFGDSSVDFWLLVWVADSADALVVGPELRLQIWDAFKEKGIGIPFPQRDLHIKSSDVPLGPAGPEAQVANEPPQ